MIVLLSEFQSEICLKLALNLIVTVTISFTASGSGITFLSL